MFRSLLVLLTLGLSSCGVITDGYNQSDIIPGDGAQEKEVVRYEVQFSEFILRYLQELTDYNTRSNCFQFIVKLKEGQYTDSNIKFSPGTCPTQPIKDPLYTFTVGKDDVSGGVRRLLIGDKVVGEVSLNGKGQWDIFSLCNGDYANLCDMEIKSGRIRKIVVK